MKEMQLGLMFNGLLKVPMQFFILLVGVMVFVFYQFNPSPLNFNPLATETVLNSNYAEEYKAIQREQEKLFEVKQEYLRNKYHNDDAVVNLFIKDNNKALDELREQSKTLISKAAKELQVNVETNDKDYVFIHFILNRLPRGLIGLLLAVILSAAMSSTASELNALATTTTLDLYARHQTSDQANTVKITKWFTFIWGILAIIIACVAYLADNLIQLVNIIGSIFYGNVLGIFLLAFFFKSVKGSAVFTAAIITQLIIISLFLLDFWGYIKLPYLWLNFIGCFAVIGIAVLLMQLYYFKLNE
jgi:Na+/proline symporter